MSNVNNQFKELINEAIHNHFHDNTETEMILKDWLYGICEQLDEYEAKAQAFDEMKAKYEENLNYVKGLSGEGLEGSVFHEMVLGASVINYFRESGEYDAKK